MSIATNDIQVIRLVLVLLKLSGIDMLVNTRYEQIIIQCKSTIENKGDIVNELLQYTAELPSEIVEVNEWKKFGSVLINDMKQLEENIFE